MILMKKKNGKWRICINFTDLNKACPKDNYPLPSIDQLVDATSGYELLTFMGIFFGYNQIWIAPKDEEKIIFVTNQDLFRKHMLQLSTCGSNVLCSYKYGTLICFQIKIFFNKTMTYFINFSPSPPKYL